MHRLPILPLTKAAFSAFGDVVEADGADVIAINQGFAMRTHGLARIDLGAGRNPVNVSLLDAKARPAPIRIQLMERHPLGSQLFFPLEGRPWLIVVCSEPHDVTSFRAFQASGRQGVNYARNVWHHPLLVLRGNQRFLVVDYPTPDNLEEVMLTDECCIPLEAAR
jgi:ureidoglycolate lyase